MNTLSERRCAGCLLRALAAGQGLESSSPAPRPVAESAPEHHLGPLGPLGPLEQLEQLERSFGPDWKW